MLFVLPPFRGILGSNVRHLRVHSYRTNRLVVSRSRHHHPVRRHTRCLCMAISNDHQPTSPSTMTSRERRQAAVRARCQEHINMKRELDAKPDPLDVVQTVVMVPRHIRERCCLNARMGKVKIFLDQADTNDVAVFHDKVRCGIVRLFPELEERGLLGAHDGYDLRLNGSILSNCENPYDVIADTLAQCERAGSPLYVEIIPHNVPAAKPPLSERVDRARTLTAQLEEDGLIEMQMVSFYKFVDISDPSVTASTLSRTWSWLGVKGRVYVATEGINAQLAVPTEQWKEFRAAMNGEWSERGEYVIPSELQGVYLNVDRVVTQGRKEEGAAFEKLHVRPREKILADGMLPGAGLDWTGNSGREVSPEEWHQLLLDTEQNEKSDTILLDCRNDYESDVGRFDGAEPLNTQTFRETWQRLEDRLRDEPRDKPILTYCTGGIRCVKVNAFLQQRMGFTNTGRLAGGIVSYTKSLRDQGKLDASKFKGVNHVFDGRMGEVVTDDLLDRCVNCGTPCNVQTDCANVSCPRTFDRRIFVQCEECAIRLHGACSSECRDILMTNETVQHHSSKNLTTTAVISDCCNKHKEKEEGEVAVELQHQAREKDQDLSDHHESATVLASRTSDRSLYAQEFTTAEPAFLADVRRRATEAFPSRLHIMSSSPQGQLLKTLVQLSGARRVLEIGTFVGYATLYMALGLEADGCVVTCESDEEVADVAAKLFRDVQRHEFVRADIELLRGPADESLRVLAERQRQFDFVFVDANKSGYVDYVQTILDRNLVPVNGTIVADNVLFRDEVPSLWREEQDKENNVDDQRVDELGRKRLKNLERVRKTAKHMHNFNQFMKDEDRLEQVVVDIRDGLTIARRVS